MAIAIQHIKIHCNRNTSTTESLSVPTVHNIGLGLSSEHSHTLQLPSTFYHDLWWDCWLIVTESCWTNSPLLFWHISDQLCWPTSNIDLVDCNQLLFTWLACIWQRVSGTLPMIVYHHLLQRLWLINCVLHPCKPSRSQSIYLPTHVVFCVQRLTPLFSAAHKPKTHSYTNGNCHGVK